MKTKRIVSIEVVKAGSNPDVDSDIRTDVRDAAIEHVGEVHGHDNVANIITFTTLAAKGAFKNLCTIYDVPFAAATKISNLVPPPVEGVDLKLKDIFDSKHDRYSEGKDFRDAVSTEEWKQVLTGAQAVEDRIKAYGVHACGIIMSSKPLQDTIPLWVRSSDHRVVTQWTYGECESLGLIKFDLLGLDTVDIIQHAVEYVAKNKKTPPNMLDLLHGAMDDRLTYERIFSTGNTVGIFQFGTDLVTNYCKKMKPESFEDLAATTALCRPGPMGMSSHYTYAARKNGLEAVTPLHPAFRGSALDEILGSTYGLCVYQEQIMKIANQIAGFTLQEGDDLRSAMGKKKIEKMAAMKPAFIAGGMARGFPEDAMELLWDTIAEFAKYGFNRSHSVAYAMNAYSAAYLKTHYPVEFMAALLAQNSGKKDKLLMFLPEARRMGLKVGATDINSSDVRVSPDFTGRSFFDILFGLSGVDAVSTEVARIIVEEREAHGPYTSVKNLIDRCSPLGVTNKKVYENLTLAGAFDCFSHPRRTIVENLPALLGEAKTKASMGANLFDMFGEEEEHDSMALDLTQGEDYAFVDKLKLEAGVLGLYLTAHPLERAGQGLAQARVVKLDKLMKAQKPVTVTVVGALTEIKEKRARKGGKSVSVIIDDGSGYLTAALSREVVKGLDKWKAQKRIEKFYTSGETSALAPVVKVNLAEAVDEEFTAVPELEKNNLYLMSITFRPERGENPYGARVNAIRPFTLAHGGELPLRIRMKTAAKADPKAAEAKLMKFAEGLAKKFPGTYPLHVAVVTPAALKREEAEEKWFTDLAREITSRPAKAEGVKKTKDDECLLPARGRDLTGADMTEEELAESIEYIDTGLRVDKAAPVEEFLSSKFGAERVDYGVFNSYFEE